MAAVGSEIEGYGKVEEHWMMNPVTGQQTKVKSQMVHERLLSEGWQEI
jgi:hypothetical protein